MRLNSGRVRLYPKWMLSSTLKWGNNKLSWNMYPMRLRSGGRFIFSDDEKRMFPFNTISPSSGRSKPAIQFRRVVFPLPDGPNITITPLGNVAETSSLKSPSRFLVLSSNMLAKIAPFLGGVLRHGGCSGLAGLKLKIVQSV